MLQLNNWLNIIGLFPPNELKDFLDNPVEFSPSPETLTQFNWLNDSSPMIQNSRRKKYAREMRQVCDSIVTYQREQNTNPSIAGQDRLNHG